MQRDIEVVFPRGGGDVVDTEDALFFGRKRPRLLLASFVGGFTEAQEASLGTGILRCRVGGGGAEVEGSVEDFAGEDCIGG